MLCGTRSSTVFVEKRQTFDKVFVLFHLSQVNNIAVVGIETSFKRQIRTINRKLSP